MTVQSTTARADYQGNGITTQFPVPFYFLDPTHLKVLRTDKSTTPPTTALLVLNSDYTVVGAGVQSGGLIAATVAPTATQTLTVLRNVPFTQLIHYVPNDPFPAATHEQALDQLTMEVQELNELATHALTFPTYESVPPTIPPAAQRASTMLGFDANGNPTYLPIPASVGAGDLRNEAWTAGTDYVAGTSTSVTLSRAYGTKANLGSVVMAGVPQDPNSYSLSGTTLTFIDPTTQTPVPIPAGVGRIWCDGGTTLSTQIPPDNSVTDAKIAAPSILSNRMTGARDIRDYGAVSGTTHTCTAALNAFIADAINAGGGRLYVPPGTWRFDAKPNDITVAVEIFGAGLNSSVLLRDYVEVGTYVGLLNFVGVSGFAVRQLGIDASAASSGGALICGTSTASIAGSATLEDLWLSTLGSNNLSNIISLDGTLKTTGAMGFRDTAFRNVHAFGVSNVTNAASVRLASIEGFQWHGGGVYAAGGTGAGAGEVQVTGTPGVTSNNFIIDIITASSFAFDNCANGAVRCPSFSGSISNAGTATGIVFQGGTPSSVLSNWSNSSVIKANGTITSYP